MSRADPRFVVFRGYRCMYVCVGGGGRGAGRGAKLESAWIGVPWHQLRALLVLAACDLGVAIESCPALSLDGLAVRGTLYAPASHVLACTGLCSLQQ